MEMKFKIGQKVMSSGIKCQIIATKHEPYRPKINPFNRSVLFPEKDYLLIKLKNLHPLEFKGLLDVTESQIQGDEWI